MAKLVLLNSRTENIVRPRVVDDEVERWPARQGISRNQRSYWLTLPGTAHVVTVSLEYCQSRLEMYRGDDFRDPVNDADKSYSVQVRLMDTTMDLSYHVIAPPHSLCSCSCASPSGVYPAEPP